MKAYLEQLLRGVSDPIVGRNLVREYLQATILANLQNAGGMSPFGVSIMTGLRCWR